VAIRVAVRHNTYYRFDRPVTIAPHVLRLRPAPHCRNRIYSYSLRVKPDNHFINWQQDPFGNFLARLVFPEKEDHLSVEVELITDMTVINPFDFFVEEYAEHYPFGYDAQLLKELGPYLEIVEDGPLLNQWLRDVPRDERPIIDFLVLINQRLERDIEYNVRMEPGVQTCEETLQLARGSCRDTGWLMVQILRHLGLAARFCSGYLVQLAPDV
jgi:transglutaminase-like putative cysteine protease